jgi:lipopolysaccharide transport system ATP-binding protein
LLKILSRTTTPTTGSLRLRGRVASLLEVGTGFHPELSGRENIYLNGAILGMSRKEIARKFDEIVDFSGVERYIDTPVKRYSSGMYVRLAFAVAAHLESEILIVDEVLAVGDAEFQKKCLGKMGDVSKGEGRTVLFVSHNLAAIKALCNNSILLKNGEFQFQGISDEAVRLYLKNTETLESNLMNRKDREGNGKVIVSGITLKNDRDEPVSNIMSGDFLSIEVDLYTRQDTDFSKLIVACSLSDPYQMKVVSWVSDEMKVVFHSDMKPRFSLLVPKLNLRPGVYDINIQLSLGTTSPEDISDVILSASQITVVDSDYFLRGKMIRSGHMAILDGQYAL